VTAPGTVTRTNLVTNPGYEVGTACFASNSGSVYPVTADTTAPIAGTRSAMSTRQAANPNNTAMSCYFGPVTGKYPVTPGVPVTWSISWKTDVAGTVFNAFLYWYDAANVRISTSPTVQSPPAVYGVTQRLVVKAVPPANAVGCWAGATAVVQGSITTEGQRVWMDLQVFENADTDGSYFDGDTPPGGGYRYAWLGAVHASQSVQVVASPAPPLILGPGPGVALYVDGARIADGSDPDDTDDAVTALSGLSVTWGRSTTVDQPEPSTCTFTAVDLGAARPFLDTLYAGAAVRVVATGDTAAPATLPANADPSFEFTAPGDLPPSWYPVNFAAVTTEQAASGVQSVKITQPGGGRNSQVSIAPGPLSTDPDAWDDIPAMHPGEHWSITAALYSPNVATQVRLGGRRYDRPDVSGGTLDATMFTTTPGQWLTVTVDITVPDNADQQWLGVDLVAYWPTWADASGTWADASGTWADAGVLYVDDIYILAPQTAGIVHREAVVFDGRVTDLSAGWDDAVGGVAWTVTAVDFTADLANRDVGAPPWPAERLDKRFVNILAGAGLDDWSIGYSIAPTLAPRIVTWMDVDRQQAAPLLQDLATSVDGVLWSAVHATRGAYLALVDPAVAAALWRLLPDDETGLYVIVPTAAADNIIDVDAADLLRDPVVFHQSTADVITRAAVTWQEQTVGDDGIPAPTERTETLIDAELELALGTRRIAVATLLTTAADAIDVGGRILARLHAQSWRVGALTWPAGGEMDGDRRAAALDLLDGTRRLAAPLLLTNLPAWAPDGPTVPLYLQGGRYTFDGGAWTLELITASAHSQGVSMTWQDLDPSISWADVDPSVTWLDLIGVTP
jgi:hypothetical protein